MSQAFNLIELEYADGGKAIFEIKNILGIVSFNWPGATHLNVLLNGGHVVSVSADYKKLVKRVWGEEPNAEMRAS